MRDGKFRSERVLLFTTLVLKVDKNVKGNKKIRELIKMRMEMWERGEFEQLLVMAQRCEKQFPRRPKMSRKERLFRRFHILMAERKYRQANREVTDRSESSGVLDPNEEAMGKGGPLGKTNIEVFEEKHPKPNTPVQEAFLDGPLPVKEDIVISANVIERVARAASGSAGVSGADSECWKSLLVSHGKASERLREAVADLATKMSNEVMEWSDISALLARRGLMLDKKPGLRPIGVGEVLQRILAKSVAWITKWEVTQECGADNLAGG